MAKKPQTQSSEPTNDNDSELEKLEEDVNQMAQKILEYRTTLPDQLKNSLASILAAQRPLFATRFDYGSEPGAGPSTDPNPDVGRPSESGNMALLPESDQENAGKIQLLKDKISSNVSAMPIILKRMKECMTRIDKLESCSETIHPAFKRQRTS